MPKETKDDNFTVSVGVRSGSTPTEYRCDHLYLRVGDSCVVDTERGPNIGVVMRARMKIRGRKFCCRLRNVIRKATKEDMDSEFERLEKEKKISDLARKKIAEFELGMKLTRVEVTFDGKRAIIAFTSEGRIDFRDMVKALSSELDVKIEMRQMGSRDEARLLGGCGICGNSLCCSTFMSDFAPVSIKMAKNQNLSLNPAKISGVCGRLMCCLVFENEFYKEMQKKVPRVGRTVMTPDGKGRVAVADYLRERVTVDIQDKGFTVYEAKDVSIIQNPQHARSQSKKQGQKGRRNDSKRENRPEIKSPEPEKDGRN